jgi:hypothetical protein
MDRNPQTMAIDFHLMELSRMVSSNLQIPEPYVVTNTL